MSIPSSECVFSREVKISCAFEILWALDENEYDAGRAAAVVANVRQATKTCGYFDMPTRTDIMRLHYPKIGESCGENYSTRDTFICPESTYCAYSTAAKTPICTAFGVEGDPCDSDNQPCAVGFKCVADQGNEASCVRRLREGESCTEQFRSYKVCQDGLECVVMSLTEAECHPPRANGEMCAAYSDCKSQFCDVEQDADFGKCKACASGDDCAGAYCVDGGCTVTVPKADGSSCRYDYECKNGECFYGECGRQSGDDMFCFSAEDIEFCG